MYKFKLFVFMFLMFGGIGFAFYSPLQTSAYAQQPTGSVPTVTGTPSGAIVALYLDENRPQEMSTQGQAPIFIRQLGFYWLGRKCRLMVTLKTKIGFKYITPAYLILWHGYMHRL